MPSDPLVRDRSAVDPLATAEQRKNIWGTIAALSIHDGRFGWAKQALKFAAMDDPPREWPADSEPARMLRGEFTPPKVSWPKRALGWLLWKVMPNG